MITQGPESEAIEHIEAAHGQAITDISNIANTTINTVTRTEQQVRNSLMSNIANYMSSAMTSMTNKERQVTTAAQNVQTTVDNFNNTINDKIDAYIENNPPTIDIELDSLEKIDEDLRDQIVNDYITPEQYKYVYDDAAQDQLDDDALMINAAIDDALVNGRTIHLHGTYHCKSTIYCRTNTVLIGDNVNRTNYGEYLDHTETVIESSANPAIAIYGTVPQAIIVN